MRIVPFKHVTLTAGHANAMIVDSEVFPMGSFNYAHVTIKIHTMFAMGTPPTPNLFFRVWGGNTGQEWTQFTDFDETISVPGLTEVAAYMTSAFMKVRLTLDLVSSGAGDWATAILCCHSVLARR
jgi:hypothetical protein